MTRGLRRPVNSQPFLVGWGAGGSSGTRSGRLLTCRGRDGVLVGARRGPQLVWGLAGRANMSPALAHTQDRALSAGEQRAGVGAGIEGDPGSPRPACPLLHSKSAGQ